GGGTGASASLAGRVRRDRRRPMRLLHPRHPDERARVARPQSPSHARRDRSRTVRQSLPLHGLYEDLRGRRARGRPLARACRGGWSAVTKKDRQKPSGAPSIPPNRMMPSEERLAPPRWEGGRATAPGGGFSVIGKRNRKVEGLAKVTGQAIYADDLRLPR